MWPLAALTGFSHKMYGCFAGTKTSGRNHEVAVWRGSTVFQILLCDVANLIVLTGEKLGYFLHLLDFCFLKRTYLLKGLVNRAQCTITVISNGEDIFI